jgi:hypothetical protein
VETPANFDLDAELKIWLSGNPVPIRKQFSKGVDIYEVQALLTHFVTGWATAGVATAAIRGSATPAIRRRP